MTPPDAPDVPPDDVPRSISPVDRWEMPVSPALAPPGRARWVRAGSAALVAFGLVVVTVTTADSPTDTAQASMRPGRVWAGGPGTPVGPSAPGVTAPSAVGGSTGSGGGGSFLAEPASIATALPDQRAAVAVKTAMAQIGLPYVWGGDGPEAGDRGFDCSGLTHYAYGVAGIDLPRTAHTQFRAGPRVPDGAPLQPGDLVFYGTYRKVHHVGMYIGSGRMVNAPTFGKPVQTAWYRWSGDDYVGATRPASSDGDHSIVPGVPAVPDPSAPASPPEFLAPPAPPLASVPDPDSAQPPESDSAAQSREGADKGTPPLAEGQPDPTWPDSGDTPPTGPTVTAAPTTPPGSTTPGRPTTPGKPTTRPTQPPTTRPTPPPTTRPTPPPTTRPTPPPTSRPTPPPTSRPTPPPTTRPTTPPAPPPATTTPPPVRQPVGTRVPASPTPAPTTPPATAPAGQPALVVGSTRAAVTSVPAGADGLPSGPGLARGPHGWVAQLRTPLAAGPGTPITLRLPDGRTLHYTVSTRSAPGPRSAAASANAPLVLLVPADGGRWVVLTAR